jgi:hypothetical protein
MARIYSNANEIGSFGPVLLMAEVRGAALPKSSVCPISGVIMSGHVQVVRRAAWERQAMIIPKNPSSENIRKLAP